MKKLTTFLLLMFPAGATAAQEIPLNAYKSGNDVEIRAIKQGEYNVFTAHKNQKGKYSLYMEFNTDQGKRTTFDVIESESKYIFKWPVKSARPGFTYRYYPGEVNGKVDSSFVYRLPFAKDARRPVRILKFDRPESNGGNEITEYANYVFSAQENDDIYAMRKGVVSKIGDTRLHLKNLMDGQEQAMTNKHIFVEHTDGTTARYAGIMEGTVTVNEGDTVYPETILGKPGTLDGKRYEIRVYIDFLTAPKKGGIPDLYNVKRNMLNPWFLTDAGTVQLEDGKEYGSVVTEKLLTEEISKREQKNRNNKK